ncbi:MAG TPA: hypothetical protein VM243_12595 [Phycisphaerae bacterium]|nr:hypothetical protein [Phycisphaerae bacterium]
MRPKCAATDFPSIEVRPRDWAELGGMVQRAARRALAVYLVEAAARTAGTPAQRHRSITRSDGR